MESDNCQICGDEYQLDDLFNIKLGNTSFDNLKICKICQTKSNDLENLQEANKIIESLDSNIEKKNDGK